MMDTFRETLTAFGRHLRDPQHVARPPGIAARSAKVYGELVTNNLAGFLDSCFPVCRATLGESRWRRLARRFLRDWPCRTPWFREIPQEFLAFLETHGEVCRLPRWLCDLARYEQAELAVELMDCEPPACLTDGDLMAEPVVVNPALVILECQWPVHLIGPKFRPHRNKPVWLAVYRDPSKEAPDKVGFSLLSPASARLLDILRQGRFTGEDAVLRLAAELGHPEPGTLLAFGAQEIRALQQSQLILGVEP